MDELGTRCASAFGRLVCEARRLRFRLSRCTLRRLGMASLGAFALVASGWSGPDPNYLDAVVLVVPYRHLGLADLGRARPAAAVATATTLTSFTPTAAFRGNQTALVGAALNPSSPVAASVLVRESDCTLTQYAYAAFLDGTTPTKLPGFEVYAHKISGLTTTAGTFPKGCADRRLGTPSSVGTFLGRAANGDLLIAAFDASQQIAVLRLNSQGAYISTTTLGDQSNALTVAAADLNGDGIADIVTPLITAGGKTGIGVFLSRPDGSFGPVTVYPGYPSGVNPLGGGHVSIQDINGDGKPDIVGVATSLDITALPTMVALLGVGDGTFRAGTGATTSIGIGPFVIADFDGDGKADVLSAGGNLLRGNGDGSFGAPVPSFGPTLSGSNLAVGDFNGDGKPDVAIVTYGGNGLITILLGKGDGTFLEAASYAGIRGTRDLSVTDIDGDGNDDIVVGLGGPGAIGPGEASFTVIQFLLGKGDGSFAGARAIRNQNFIGFGNPALADFNGDGFPDIAIARDGKLTLYLGSASGFGSASAPIPLALFQPRAVAAGDFNGDGKIDLVVADRDFLAVMAGRGDGSFAAARVYPLPAVAAQFGKLAVADFNGDGRADVLVTMQQQSAATGGAFVYIANADGSLKAPVQIDAAVNLGGLAVGDLNGDGRADIAVGGLDPQFYLRGSNTLLGVRVYLSNADGSFSLAATLTQAGAVAYPALAIADMNKDGKADLVFGTLNSGFEDLVVIAPGLGDGSFGAATTFALPGGGPGIRSLAVADFNFDGNPDVMLAGGNYSAVLIGNGDGTITGMNALVIAGGGTAVIAADLDKDGVSDAVMATTQGIVPLVRVRSVIEGAAPPPTADFSIAAAVPAAQTVTAGQSASTVLTLTPSGGFTGNVTLSCSGLPAGASCTFAPAALDLNGTAKTSTLTIGTAAHASLGVVSASGGGDGGGFGSRGALLATAASLLVLAWSRHAGQRAQRRWRAVGLLGVAGLVNACGGATSPDAPAEPRGGTPAGSYAVSITATSGAVSHSTSFTLTVN